MKLFLVNFLTGLRLVLGLLFVVLILVDHDLLATGVLCIVYLSDYFDGYLAGRWSVATSGGALFDLAADALFVFMAYAALTITGAIPQWFFLAAVLKFAEFAATSAVLSRGGDKKAESVKTTLADPGNRRSRWVPVFDSLGKASGILFMISPLAIVGLFGLVSFDFASAVSTVLEILITVCAGMSSSHRIYLCCRTFRKNETQDSLA